MALQQSNDSGGWALHPITSARTHHYNPFLSADGAKIGYHRCRCLGVEGCDRVPPLERYTPVMPGALTLPNQALYAARCHCFYLNNPCGAQTFSMLQLAGGPKGVRDSA